MTTAAPTFRPTLPVAHALRPLLMFQGGVAEAAMTFYTGLFPDATIDDVERFADGEPGAGLVKQARFRIAGQELRCFDSPIPHAFGFTPSLSLAVECESAAELERLFAALSEGGKVLMPLDDYGFSTRFGWTDDRFGVSWQLNLA